MSRTRVLNGQSVRDVIGSQRNLVGNVRADFFIGAQLFVLELFQRVTAVGNELPDKDLVLRVK